MTEVDEIDQIRPMSTEKKTSGQKWTEQNQSGQNGLNRTKVN